MCTPSVHWSAASSRVSVIASSKSRASGGSIVIVQMPVMSSRPLPVALKERAAAVAAFWTASGNSLRRPWATMTDSVSTSGSPAVPRTRVITPSGT